MSAVAFRAAGDSHPGKVRGNNEDSYTVVDVVTGGGLYHLLALADGMGGGSRGEDASRIAIETVVGSIEKAEWQDPQEALAKAISCANAAVFAEGTGHGQAPRSLMGTTLVLALVESATGKVWIANVGDSRAYISQGGVLRQATEDHSLLAEQARTGVEPTNRTQAARWRSALTRGIGLESAVKPDIVGPEQLGDGDSVLLCSDGLHGMVSDAAISRIAARSSMSDAPRALVDAANRAGGHDNVTVVVGRFGDEPDPGLAGDSGDRHPWSDLFSPECAPWTALGLAAVLILIALGVAALTVWRGS